MLPHIDRAETLRPQVERLMARQTDWHHFQTTKNRPGVLLCAKIRGEQLHEFAFLDSERKDQRGKRLVWGLIPLCTCDSGNRKY